MTLTPEGGAAIPVSVTTTRKVQGGAAIPVYGYMTAPTDGRPAMGGAAIPVRVLTAADLKQNGGMWTLEGGPHAMPVYTAPATTTVMGGPALAVYPVNAWPTVPVVPAWVPTDIAGLQLWLKADVGLYKDAAKAQPVTADADAVYTWADQSGNGRDAVQATAGARPLYKVNVQNGLAVVRFDGSDDLLASVFAVPITETTLIAVGIRRGAVSATTGAFTGFCNSDGTAFSPAIGVNATGPVNTAYAYDTGARYCNGESSALNTAVLLVGTFKNNDNINLYENGTQKTPVALGTMYSTGIDRVFVGWQGADPDKVACDIAEVLIYNSALSAANRAKVETYLNGRWSVY